jgi:hypothetical protein
VGCKTVRYAQGFYDPEAYNKLIRHDWSAYYRDDGSPPADPFFTTRYALEDRAALRDQLYAAVTACAVG